MGCRRVWAILILLLAAIGRVDAGVVRTADGRAVEGRLNLADGQVLVQPRSGQVIRIDADDVISLAFDAADAGAGAEGGLPAGWDARDIGAVGLAGSAGAAGGIMTIAGSGGGIEGRTDAFHLVCQPRAGDIDLIVRVLRMQNTHERAGGGLMLRTSDEPGSPYAALLVHPSGRAQLIVRSARGRDSIVFAPVPVEWPVWLKLTRRGNVVTGYWSNDGARWERAADARLDLGPQVLAGMAVTSHTNIALCTTQFADIALAGDEPSGADGPGGATLGGGAASTGIVLRDGSVLSGIVREVIVRQGADGAVVKLMRYGPGGGALDVAVEHVARIVYRPVTAPMMAGLLPGATGVLLGNGDFFEGEIAAIADGRITVSSVLYGIRTFKISDDVAVVVRADARKPHGAVRVTGRDGSVLVGDRLLIERDRIVLEHAVLGRVGLARGQVERVMAAGARSAALASVTWRAAGARGDVVAEADGTVRLAAGSTATWALEGRFGALLCGLAADERGVPMALSRLVILADGREVYRGDDLTSIDPAAPITLPLAGVRELTVRVESTPESLGPALLLREPLLVRASPGNKPASTRPSADGGS